MCALGAFSSPKIDAKLKKGGGGGKEKHIKLDILNPP
jgi:hypothetical protein